MFASAPVTHTERLTGVCRESCKPSAGPQRRQRQPTVSGLHAPAGTSPARRVSDRHRCQRHYAPIGASPARIRLRQAPAPTAQRQISQPSHRRGGGKTQPAGRIPNQTPNGQSDQQKAQHDQALQAMAREREPSPTGYPSSASANRVARLAMPSRRHEMQQAESVQPATQPNSRYSGGKVR
jgi:hypothetical protein